MQDKLYEKNIKAKNNNKIKILLTKIETKKRITDPWWGIEKKQYNK